MRAPPPSPTPNFVPVNSDEKRYQNQQEQAAQLLAEGRYQYAEIAEKIGIEVRTLYQWRTLSAFTKRVSQLSSDFQKRSWSLGITRKHYRITCLAAVHSKLLTVMEQRAEDPDMQNVPGGKTGLMVKTFKVSGDTVMAEYAVDAGLIRELRGIQEQVAKELGQVVEKHEHKFNIKNMSDEDLERLAADLTDEESPSLEAETP